MGEFWTQGKLEPKRQYRWQVNIGGFGDDADNPIRYVAKKVNKPEMTVEEAAHKYLNHTYYYPGRVTWNEISMTLIDPIDVNSSQRLGKLLYDAGYLVPNNSNEVTTISKAAANTALGAVTIMQFRGGPTVTPPLADAGPTTNARGNGLIETWTLNNPFIRKVNFGSLDYGSEELVDIELTIRYDWATYQDDKNEVNLNSPLWKLGGPTT